MIMKYKESKDFMQEIIENLVEAYHFGFIDCKIIVIGEPKEGMASKEEEAINVEEDTTEAPVTEVIASILKINTIEELTDPVG